MSCTNPMTTRLILAAAAVALQTACPPPSGTPDAGTEIDRKPVLGSIASNVILPTYVEANTEAKALKATTAAWVAALDTAEAEARRQEAQAAWKNVMRTWQEAELMQLGPTGLPEMAGTGMTGGLGLRDEIYSWHNTNSCRVDQELVANRFGDAGYFGTVLVNAYGLDALEYLLFNEAAENTCAPQATINANGSWAALSAQELATRRARYADAAAGYLVEKTQALVDAWDPGSGNFVAKLAHAGEAGSLYSSARMAADELFAALFYLDLKTKDLKVAVPAGLSLDCTATTCPGALENRWSDTSKVSLVQNLRGFRKMFLGNGSDEEARPGFDDWLRDAGHGAVADALVADVDAAIARVEAIPGTLEESLARDPEELRQVHADIKKVTDVLKTQLSALLSLRVPEGGSDND